jgi:hypothetical protein
VNGELQGPASVRGEHLACDDAKPGAIPAKHPLDQHNNPSILASFCLYETSALARGSVNGNNLP